MPLSHLIAVNVHPFHGLNDILNGLESLARAVGEFRQRTLDKIEVRLFWHNEKPAPAEIRDNLSAHGFDLTESPHRTNGENLNSQIEYALGKDFDIFYRVDGDDTVTAQRFLHQAALLASKACDICGGALRYKPSDGAPFTVIPRQHPGPRDYLENHYILHPSMAFRLEAIRAAGLRYWPKRLEDKALILAARRAGLRVRNLPTVAGGYNVGPRARNRLTQKWTGLKLNLAFLRHERALHLVPYALALFAGQVVLGSNRLRRLRHMLNRRDTARLRTQDRPQN